MEYIICSAEEVRHARMHHLMNGDFYTFYVLIIVRT